LAESTQKFGLLGVFVGLLLFPATFSLVPWYAAFVDGNWQPVMVVYGMMAAALGLFLLGSLIDKD
jgi:ABC-type glycerol-3-phosphate transport system permease component